MTAAAAPPAAREPESGVAIVFFDGVCGLCNRFVDYLVRHDHARRLRYAPLQGETAAAHPQLPRDVDSVIVLDGANVLVRSDAALRALTRLGGAYRLLSALHVIPRVIRDAVYSYVARNRYRWFGQHDACRLPSADEAHLFLP